MAKKTKKEFADICEIKTKDLSVYIMRHKVLVGNDGLIDDKNEHNLAFIANRGRKTKKKTIVKHKPKARSKLKTKTKQSQKKKAEEPKEKTLEIKFSEPQNPILEVEIYERAELDKAKLKADLKKKLLDSDIAKINKEKLQGLLIPTDLVMSVIKLQSDSLKVAYHAAAENLILIIGQRKKLNNKDIADIRRDLTGTINQAVNVGVSESHKGIKKIVKEYSMKQLK